MWDSDPRSFVWKTNMLTNYTNGANKRCLNENFSNGFPHLKGISCTLDYIAIPTVVVITRVRQSRGMIFLVLRRIMSGKPHHQVNHGKEGFM